MKALQALLLIFIGWITVKHGLLLMAADGGTGVDALWAILGLVAFIVVIIAGGSDR